MLKLFELQIDPAFHSLLTGISLQNTPVTSDFSFVPGTQLIDPEFIKQQLHLFAQQKGWENQNLSAVASMWSKSYLSLFTGGWLIARVFLDREIVTSVDRLLLIQNELGLITSVAVPNEGRAVASIRELSDFIPLFRQHIEPHFLSLSQVTGIKVSVLWSNVASGVDTLLKMLNAYGLLTPEKLQVLNRLFTEKFWPDGERNLMYRPVFTRISPTGETVYLRKGCCLRYLLSEMGYCKNCCLPQAWQANFPGVTTDS